MSGLNWKPFVYGGLASIVAEFGKNVNTDKSAACGINGSLRWQLFLVNASEKVKRKALFVLKTIVSKPSSNIFWESSTNSMESEVKKSQT